MQPPTNLGLKPATLLKKKLRNRCFPVRVCVFFENFSTRPLLTEHRRATQGSDRNFKVKFPETSSFSREFQTKFPEILLK